MNKIINIIFKGYIEMPPDVSPLETPELNNELHHFVDTYFGADIPFDNRWNANVRLNDLISNYQKKAFEVGFYTAVQLLTTGKEI